MLYNSDDDDNEPRGKKNGKFGDSDEEDEEGEDDIERFISNVTKKPAATAQPMRAAIEVPTDVLEAVEKNERTHEVGMVDSEALDQSQANQLLSFDKKFYQKVTRNLFQYNEYADIVSKLFVKRDHQFSGVPSCVGV